MSLSTSVLAADNFTPSVSPSSIRWMIFFTALPRLWAISPMARSTARVRYSATIRRQSSSLYQR